MKLAEEAEPLGVVVLARCDLQMDGCTAREPAPVTIVRVGPMRDQFVVCTSCMERMIREGEWSVRGSRISPHADFIVKDHLDRILVTVEVKVAPRTSAVDLPHWAAGLRRNLAAHAAIPRSQYFLLLVVPEAGCLWSNSEASFDALPDYTFNLLDVANPGEKIPSQTGHDAEAWAERWLQSLFEGRVQPSGLWWKESGLARLIQGGALRLVPQGKTQ